jgi:hypothetical protein
MQRKAKVFISCGQGNATENRIASELEVLFKGRDFNPYVAARVQRLGDLPRAIIDELVGSDYFVFVDFRREALWDVGLRIPRFKGYRGSLYSHQELALAHYLEFGENVVALQQRRVCREGFLQHMQVNAQLFDRPHEVPALVGAQVDAKGWRSDFSRHLVPEIGNRPGVSYWQDHSTPSAVRRYVWGVRVHNRRRDRAALNVTASMRGLALRSGDQSSAVGLQDNTWLKWAGHSRTYSMVIPPRDYRSFDAFSVDPERPERIFLNSLFDRFSPDPGAGTYRRDPIIEEAGKYLLTYRVDAIAFPAMEFDVCLDVTGRWETTQATAADGGVCTEPSPYRVITAIALDAKAGILPIRADQPQIPGSGSGGQSPPTVP